MSRQLNKLSAATLKATGPGKIADGGGLWFHKREDGGAQWFLRVTVHGRRREMGLGRFPDVSLREARLEADKWRAVVRQGLDPIKERERIKREEAGKFHLLKDVALDAFESRKAELKGDGKAGRWYSPLELHVLPKLGKVPIADIDQKDIRDTLTPIWHEKADTARKALNRLNIVFRHAAALGLDVDLQATDKAKALLGKQRHKAKNIPAMRWQEVPEFYRSLDGGTSTELALRLLILTVARSYPLRHIHLDQIDDDVWTIPAQAMKGRRDATSDFRVPLSSEALAVIEQAKPLARDGLLYPGLRRGVISDMTMSGLMKRKRLVERPHGFRSSFRDWVAETQNVPHDVAETCLGHVVGGSVVRAYKRTDFLGQRRAVMEKWGNLLSGTRPQVLVLPRKGI